MNCMTAQSMMGQFQFDPCHTEHRNHKKHHAKGECLFCLPAGLFTLFILLLREREVLALRHGYEAKSATQT
jgi:hypothetical protein